MCSSCWTPHVLGKHLLNGLRICLPVLLCETEVHQHCAWMHQHSSRGSSATRKWRGCFTLGQTSVTLYTNKKMSLDKHQLFLDSNRSALCPNHYNCVYNQMLVMKSQMWKWQAFSTGRNRHPSSPYRWLTSEAKTCGPVCITGLILTVH